MKKLYISRLLLYDAFVLFAIICILSCTNSEKEYSNFFFEMEPAKANSIIDFKTIDCLNESNQKTIIITNTAFELTKDVETLQFLLIIKKNQQQIDAELKKLTQKNLIIIPKLIQNNYINTDSIKSENATLYLLKKVEVEIKNQIALFESVEKNNQNIDFEIFAKKYKKILEGNSETLKTLLTE